MGYMTNDGDLFFNIGAYNFAWGGDGKDLFALMGTNNNVWRHRRLYPYPYLYL
jgi:RTX toxin RtxA